METEFDKYNRDKLDILCEGFYNSFLEELKYFKGFYKKNNDDINYYLPRVLRDKFKLDITFTTNSKLFIFKFNKNRNYDVKLVVTNDEPAETQLLGLGGEGELEVYFNGAKVNGIPLGFGFILSYDAFIKRYENVKEFVRDVVVASKEVTTSKRKNTRQEMLSRLNGIINEMRRLFFDPDIPELEIDKFIETNNIIIEHGLGLVDPIHQVVLDDVNGTIGQNLKPDLIAFDIGSRRWVIVDYKRAKSKIILNAGDVRSGFMAGVNLLHNQLRDYRMYFFDHKQCMNFNSKYKRLIENPGVFGIIGNVSDAEERDFNRSCDDLPNWIKIIPYNYIYDKFCRYVTLVEKLP